MTVHHLRSVFHLRKFTLDFLERRKFTSSFSQSGSENSCDRAEFSHLLVIFLFSASVSHLSSLKRPFLKKIQFRIISQDIAQTFASHCNISFYFVFNIRWKKCFIKFFFIIDLNILNSSIQKYRELRNNYL